MHLQYREGSPGVRVDLEPTAERWLIRAWRMRPMVWAQSSVTALTPTRRREIAARCVEWVAGQGARAALAGLPTAAQPIVVHRLSRDLLDTLYDYLLARGNRADFREPKWGLTQGGESNASVIGSVGASDIPRVFALPRSHAGSVVVSDESVSVSSSSIWQADIWFR